MRALVAISFLVSLALYLAQIFLYTKDQEIIVYGVFGALWFLALSLNAFGAQIKSTTTGIFLLSGLAAFGLGFIPHRLRLSPGIDIYVVLFPMIHFLATFAFLTAKRKAGEDRGQRTIDPAP
ncbi:hypothetical protein LDO26_06370 [Luteimonas sp. BDR2-5]|uniref:hypothetical protein n=1 Tax=Proluteimonas luteida TaxID=2878685 RepID=UPI001E3A97F7|nr:hypothetical protein [Luteimonas sp. BDR2-5]MCD9027828.1 hypothetical protein [Luteimonas sp. BDR2-5]